MARQDFDAVIVGSGPNGLAAAITLQLAGLSTLVVEASPDPGGGMRSAELTRPGFIHDVCSAVHPLALASPFFSTLPLDKFGLSFINPPLPVAHPFDNGRSAFVSGGIEETAQQFGDDEVAYLELVKSVATDWPLISADVLGPLSVPSNPMAFASFGLKAIRSASSQARRFRNELAKGMWAGLTAHSTLPLNYWSTAGIGLVLLAAAHNDGWPIPAGGSQKIADALVGFFKSIGGALQTDTVVQRVDQLPSSNAILFDVTPRQLLTIAGERFSAFYKWQLRRYRYGMGVFKVDWALSQPTPFEADVCNKAGTVHLGGTFDEIANSESMAWRGLHGDKPYVLFTQPSRFDPSRAPKGQHTAWAYCHVPLGSTTDMTDVIEKQVERFAPGFRKTILARHTFNTRQLETYNPNYVEGDIGGGAIDISQLFTRPALRFSPYRTSATGIYLCSSSTPPGGGVHGMCGYYAARRVLRDLFDIRNLPVLNSTK